MEAYNSVIKDNFGELEYEALPNLTNRQLARINLGGVPFAYRTYHPHYLWRNDNDDYFNTLIADTNFLKLRL